jgi:hypothetical protein
MTEIHTASIVVPVTIRALGPSIQLRREPTRRSWWQFWKPKFLLGEFFEGTKLELDGGPRPIGLYVGQMLVHECGRAAVITASYHTRLVVADDWLDLPPGLGWIYSYSS